MITIDKLFAQLDKGVEAAGAALVDIGLDQPIDEVALIFDSSVEVWRFIEEAVKLPGVKLFNVAEDVVRTWPIKRQYDVQYLFLETPHDYRVECMILTGGVSPLHGGLRKTHLNRVGQVVSYDAVHYSFKCTDLAEYLAIEKSMELSEWTQAMYCRSSYGIFSYWMTSEVTDDRLLANGINWCPDDLTVESLEAYIKPRVNLRDSVSEAALNYLESKA